MCGYDSRSARAGATMRARRAAAGLAGTLTAVFAGVLALATITARFGVALAEEPKAAASPGAFVLSGKDDYLFHCATCHGLEGKGDGPAALVFKIKPTNLTLLSRRNTGVFPEKRVFAVIDGTAAVQAHGSREMPVWGQIFETQGSHTFNRRETEREVRQRIQNLVDYLRSIQRK